MSTMMAISPRRHQFTVDEYHRMAEVGLLAPDARVELIEGEIIDMAPIGNPHRAVVAFLSRLLFDAVGDRAILLVQSSIRLDFRSEPQPDLTRTQGPSLGGRRDPRKLFDPAPDESSLCALVGSGPADGDARAAHLTRSPSDGFRVLQTASGAYLAVFLVSHIWATLGARFHGIDTDWAFASGGRAGMLASGVAAAVLLYYVFALFAVAVHAGLGLRMVLLSRRVRAVAANRAARLTAAFGSALSVLIIAALLGARLAG